MNQDNNINQYINTSIDTKSHTGTKLKRCSDIDEHNHVFDELHEECGCLLYTSPSPRDRQKSRMPSSA